MITVFVSCDFLLTVLKYLALTCFTWW